MATSTEKQLEDIKRLLMLLLLKLDSSSDELALAPKVDSSRVRQIMPGRGIKRIGKSG